MQHLKNLVLTSHRGILIFSLVAIIISSVALYKLIVVAKELSLVANYTNALLTGQAPLVKNAQGHQVSALPLLVQDINQINTIIAQLQASQAKKK